MLRIQIRGVLIMNEDTILDRINRINTLFDFYAPLLTDKQKSMLALYYQDNFSLGEIAAEFEVSRQAVYEHLKRAEQALLDYEGKLGLAAQYARRSELAAQLERMIRGQQEDEEQEAMLSVLARLQTIEDS
ncbi:MAG: hypothetical protein K0R57_3688 [Paenibacillaceae bacterium]|jgi:predicted DNA-binding protein YlxM (UPF0122 family)|nr:hypothetical protein [Paenibacillaceae bacterium]